MTKKMPTSSAPAPDSSLPDAASPVTQDPWAELRRFTDARIGLGRCGTSLPVAHWLAFRLAHARARDAVLTPLDSDKLRNMLKQQGIESLHLSSAVRDKQEFLTRPDKGRRLSPESRRVLDAYRETHPSCPSADLCLVVSDGLSARAIHENAVPFITLFLNRAHAAGLTCSPVVVVENGRVAAGDEIAARLGARLVVVLIGERPGLSSPNSLGVYMTYAPAPGCTDEARNCISNIRSGGLSTEEAVRKLCYLVEQAFAGQFSGVRLKDDMPDNYLPFTHPLHLEPGPADNN